MDQRADAFVTAPDPLPDADGMAKMPPPTKRFGITISPLNRRRWRNFRANRRAFWSLIVLGVLYGLSLFAEYIANDRPIVLSYRGELHFPVRNFYPETAFGGDFRTEAVYRDPEVQCLIRTGGAELCLDDPAEAMAQAETGIVDGEEIVAGWMVWPLIPYSYNTINDIGRAAPSPPDDRHWLGTDDTARDVLSRIIYGFRLSITFALIVTAMTSIIGIAAGAVQGFFGGLLDLIFQRVIELWNSVPSLYVIIILSSMFVMNFWLLVFLMTLFGWTGLVGVVRAEFLRARNFEYVRAARALGQSDGKIMIKHVLPNAMVATLTFLPFILNGSITTLTSLDFLGFGLPPGSASLGELLAQGKANLQAPWLGLTGFFIIALMLSLLIFIGEAVRDAFDPRKTFS